MECSNCSNPFLNDTNEKGPPILPKKLAETFIVCGITDGLVSEKEFQMGTNEVLGDFLYKKVKCTKCGFYLGKLLVTVDESFVYLKDFTIIEKQLINISEHSTISPTERRIIILPEEDTETDDLLSIGLAATYKDAEKLVLLLI